MTPNDLDQYLAVLAKHSTGSAYVKLPTGAEIHVNFIPKIPESFGKEPEPGGWKSPKHLDDPEALRVDEYKGELP